MLGRIYLSIYLSNLIQSKLIQSNPIQSNLVGGWATPLKNMSNLVWFFPMYGKIKNVPNHQPAIYLYPYLWFELLTVISETPLSTNQWEFRIVLWPQNTKTVFFTYPLVNKHSYWTWPFSSRIYPLKMVIFHSILYVYQRANKSIDLVSNS